MVTPAWPEQALRANIHAQISLAMNRIFTEWYPSRGFTFNITNSTSYDQYYVHGRNIFEVMEKLTDDIFNTYVRRQGTIDPYYTEYCDGKSVTCKGMKQWGTVDRAKEGKNALQILKYYYGNDIEIVRTNNLQSIPESYPGTPLRRGDSGQNVRIIQRQLTRIAKDYPFFGKPGTDGVFGAATESTVKAFQKQFSLTADGVVGRATWYKISYIYVSVKDLAELTSEGEKPSGESNVNGSTYPGSPLQVGSRGTGVERIQFWLNALSEFDPTLPGISVDGIYGAATANAVRAFQRENGLTVDGVVGSATWQALYEQSQRLRSADGLLAAFNLVPWPGFDLAVGAQGPSVAFVQFLLRYISYFYDTVQDPGKIDGIFGQTTLDSLHSWQMEFNQPETNLVDEFTWNALEATFLSLAAGVPDSTVPTAAPEYPGYVMTLGSAGGAVSQLQQAMNGIAQLYCVADFVPNDGVYGESTRDAVLAFQQGLGLPPTGVVDLNTWNKIFDLLYPPIPEA